MFIYYLYSTIKIEQYATGSGVPTLNRNEVHRHVTSIPSNPEQTKIANFLSLLDERIAAQNKIIERLESLIGGIRQSLISKGLMDGTWNLTKLSDVLTERDELNKNRLEVFSVSVSKGLINQIEYLGRSFAAKDTSHYNVVYNGDIVYTKSPTGDFPFGIVKQSLTGKCVAVSPLYGVYMPKSMAIGSIIHNYFLSPVNALNYLSSLIQKGAKNTINISNKRFLENSIPLPASNYIAELTAQLYNHLVERLKIEDGVLERLQSQKRHLLNIMFI